MYNHTMTKKIPLVLALVILIFLFLVSSAPEEKGFSYDFNLNGLINGKEIRLAIADMPQERAKGLSGHRPLSMSEGLIFIFDAEGIHGIWMKDMSFAIDVIWFDSQKKIVGMRENFEPSSFPEIAYPIKPSSYALEVASGFIKSNDLTIGGRIEFEI